MHRQSFIALIIAFLSVMAIAEESSEPAPEISVLRWNLGTDPKTLDPGLAVGSDVRDVCNQLFEGLVREQEGVVHPGMAERWTVSEDGRTVIFHLRDAKWSDGSPVTANDFVYSWLRTINPETGAEYSWIWEFTNVVGAAAANAGCSPLSEVGVRAVDDRTLVVELARPTDYLIPLLSFCHFFPVKESSVVAGPDGAWAKDSGLAVWNGPFRIESYELGSGLVLVRNEHYWNAGNVGLDVIDVKFIEEESTAYRAHQSGELDFISAVPAAEIPRLVAEEPDYSIHPLLGTYFYNFNLRLDVWQDVRVRRAFSLAINRAQITEALARGNVPATSLVPPGLLDSQGRDFRETAGDYGVSIDDGGVAEARALLAAAGFPDGKGFPRFTVLYNNTEGHALIAELVQEMWKVNLGVECTLENQEFGAFLDTRAVGNFEIARGGWLGEFPDPISLLTIFESANPFNGSRYVNLDFDTLIGTANATSGGPHFEALYRAERILMEDMPFIPIYHYVMDFLVAGHVKGWTRSTLGTLDFSGAWLVRQ